MQALVWHLGKVRAKRGAGSSASLSNRPEKEQSLRPSTVAVVQSVSALFRMLWKGVLLPDASGQRELEKICRFRLSLGSERSNYADQHTLMQLRLSFLRPATEQSSKRGMRMRSVQHSVPYSTAVLGRGDEVGRQLASLHAKPGSKATIR